MSVSKLFAWSLIVIMGCGWPRAVQSQPAASHGEAASPATAPKSSPANPATPSLPTKKKYDPRDLCITEEDASSELLNKRRQVGGRIVLDTNLLPTGGAIEVGLDESFAEADYYFAALISDQFKPVILDRPVVRPHQASDTDPLVRKKLLLRDRVVLNLQIPDVSEAPWSSAHLYLFTCRDGSPYKVSETSVRLSPGVYSAILAFVFVFLGFIIASFAFRTRLPMNPLAYFNPIPLTAGTDGKASLGKLQILMFSLIVFGLIAYFLLRTGVLTDISSTVLLLLGIAGVGSTAAKGADQSRTTIAPENRAWLIRKQWFPSGTVQSDRIPHWRDLFTTDGEFDVYRYQSFIFSLVVGGALIIGGVAQLSSFEIPTTLLGILGLSQVVYIGGKLVTPTTVADLNKLIESARDAERKFQVAATAANNGVRPVSLVAAVQPASQSAYDTYKSVASDAATLFTDQTKLTVSTAALEPSL